MDKLLSTHKARTFTYTIWQRNAEYVAKLVFIGGRQFEFIESSEAAAITAVTNFARQNNSQADENGALIKSRGYLPSNSEPAFSFDLWDSEMQIAGSPDRQMTKDWDEGLDLAE